MPFVTTKFHFDIIPTTATVTNVESSKTFLWKRKNLLGVFTLQKLVSFFSIRSAIGEH